MNRRLKIVLGIGILSITTLYAADSPAGTEQDPLVTKSYVDKLVSNMGASTNNKDMEARLTAQEKLISSLSQQIADLQSAGSFEIVTVPQNKSILGKQGSEMIIRSGQGTIIASAGGGVQDVTDGVDLQAGMTAPNNNLFIIPREDGRGIQAVRTMVVMVRGGYTLQ